MAKSLLTISQEDFAASIHKVTTSQLKKLIEDIYAFKWDSGHKWPVEIMLDIERKETKIMGELQRRRYLNLKANGEYMAWIRSINKKRRLH